MPTVVNKKGTSAWIHVTANGTVTIAGNSSVSNVAVAGETVTGATIRKIFYGSPSGNAAYWTVKRGANTVAVLDGTGVADYQQHGMALTLDAGATLVANLNGATAGYLLIEVSKQGVTQ